MSDSVEAWAAGYVRSTDLALKLDERAPPTRFEPSFTPLRIERPGRPRELVVTDASPKSPGREALRAPDKRARVLHTFLHHELQAAELMCWAILAFADAPLAFRRGLLAIARDEIRHMNLYRARIEALGAAVGDFPVRDWFWQRVPASTSPAHFVATLGVGFEGANLDHAARFAARFRAVDDEASARLQERVADEEIAHVRFAGAWFKKLTSAGDGAPSFDAWRAHLTPPLSPILMRGNPIERGARRAAGLDDAFCDELEAWSPSPGF
jgi:uncharacterized ferritin-like protein (DUF455 family)